MFAAPLFLLGLFAAGIPLLIHLRRSRQGRTIDFSTTRFFDERFMQAARRAQLQDRLLMLLRMAVVALFALALAQPLLKLPGFAAPLGGRRTVAIVLDDSASMQIVTDRGILLARAKKAAVRVLDGLSSERGDRATLVLAGRRGSGARVLFAEPTIDLEAVGRAIEQVEPTDLATDMDTACAAAAESLGPRTSTTREVFVIGDLQANALAPGTLSDLGEHQLHWRFVSIRPPAELAAENLSVDAVQYGTARPMLGVPYTFLAMIRNHGDRTRETTVRLVIDGKTIAEENTILHPDRGRVLRFVHRFEDPGWHEGRIELAGTASGDPLPADDARHFAVRVIDSARILAVNGAPSQIPVHDELFFLKAALGAAPHAAEEDGRAPQRIGVEQIDPESLDENALAPYPLVLLANVATLTQPQADALERYVDGGGNLLITLGDHVDPALYNEWVGPHRLHGGMLPARLIRLADGAEARAGESEDGSGDFIGTVNADHPALAGFAEAIFGYLSSVRIDALFDLEAADQTVLMRTTADRPLLVEKTFGRGRVMLFATSIDRDWTDFPIQPVYVPWIYRLVSYLAQGGVERRVFVHTGHLVPLAASTTARRTVHVQRPDGRFAYPEPATARDVTTPTMTIGATERAGVYRVIACGPEAGDEPVLLFAANIPHRESRTKYLDEEGVRSTAGPTAAFAHDEDEVEQLSTIAPRGFGLWDQLLFAALLAALFEPWFANRLARRRSATAPTSLDKRTVPKSLDSQQPSRGAA